MRAVSEKHAPDQVYVLDPYTHFQIRLSDLGCHDVAKISYEIYVLTSFEKCLAFSLIISVFDGLSSGACPAKAAPTFSRVERGLPPERVPEKRKGLEFFRFPDRF